MHKAIDASRREPIGWSTSFTAIQPTQRSGARGDFRARLIAAVASALTSRSAAADRPATSSRFTVYGQVSANQKTTAGTGSYSWTTSTAPSVEYQYNTGASCPTGTIQATSSGSNWSATINADCNISTTNIDFGSSGATIASAITTTGSLSVQCVSGTPFSIGLSNGSHANGSQRRMQVGSGQFLNFDLYLDSSYTQPWTTTTSTTSCTSGTNTCYLGTGTGSSSQVTIYARVPAQTATAIGVYSDTVVATVTY